MINENYKYSAITAQILKCAFEVHNVLGPGFQEIIYQRALEIEFQIQRLFEYRELEMDILYKGKSLGTRRVDFLVEEVVSVEIKAVSKLDGTDLAQATTIWNVTTLKSEC